MQIKHGIVNERIAKPLQLIQPLFRDVITEVSHHALRKVLEFRIKHLSISPGKELMKECTNTFNRTLGMLFIHIIQPLVETNQSLSVSHFHAQWHLYPDQDLEPIDNRLLALERRINHTTRGRPTGSQNAPSTNNNTKQFIGRTEFLLARPLNTRPKAAYRHVH